jgi:tetratricopeptide (TPR) repeat protein
VYWLVRRFDQAIRTARAAIALDSMGSTGYLALGGAQAAKGDYSDAVATFKRGLASSGGNRVFLPQLGYAYARAGESTEARDILRQLHELYRAHSVSPYYVAQVYLGLGVRDSALTWLEKTQKERWGHVAFIRANAVWDPLRTEPRFQRVMERLESRAHHN